MRQSLTESGKPLQEAEGVKLRSLYMIGGSGTAVIKVGSGTYHFQARDEVKPQ